MVLDCSFVNLIVDVGKTIDVSSNADDFIVDDPVTIAIDIMTGTFDVSMTEVVDVLLAKAVGASLTRFVDVPMVRVVDVSTKVANDSMIVAIDDVWMLTIH